MERFCSKCGTLVSGEGAFCPQCGAPMESAVDLSKPAESSPVSQPYSQPVQTSQPSVQPMQNSSFGGTQSAMPSYPQNYNAVPSGTRSEEMTTGQWALTLFLTAFFPVPLVSWILLFVWGFGDTPQPKKNYCRAMLIIQAITVGLVILLYVGLFACIGSMAGGLGEIFNEMSSEMSSYY